MATAATPAAAPAAGPAVAPAVAPAHATFATLFAEATTLFSSGDTERAAARYEEAARLSPDSAVVHRELGKCYSRLGRRERAQQELRRYLELAPQAADAPFYRSMLK